MSSLRRGHANLLCIVPIFADDLVRGSAQLGLRPINGALRLVGFPLWLLPIVRCKIVGAVRELNPRPLAPKARIISLDQQPTGEAALKNMLDGIRTRNPQIRSLMRYPIAPRGHTYVVKPMVRFELTTLCLQSRCNNHCAVLVRFEPVTSRVRQHIG